MIKPIRIIESDIEIELYTGTFDVYVVGMFLLTILLFLLQIL